LSHFFLLSQILSPIQARFLPKTEV
jgi:hypothetical protein